MRFASLVLAGLFVTTALLPGQGPPAKVPFDPMKNNEDWLLAKWEETMSKVDSLSADCEFTTIDTVFKSKDVYTGSAKYLRTKVALMASLELYKEKQKGVQDKNVFKKFVFTGNFLYDFNCETKVVYVHKVPQPAAGQGMDNNLLSFIFGMKAEDAKQRYDLKWQPPDGNYYYLEITPRQAQDKKDFKQARLVFLKNNFLIRQVWFVEANGNQVIWEFPKAAINVQTLKATDFSQPAVPNGWRLENAPAMGVGKG